MLKQRYRLCDGVFSESTPEGFIVMSPEGQMYRFNQVGEHIFNRCNGAHEVGEVIEIIAGEFNANSSDEVAKDVSEFVAFLVERNLVREVGMDVDGESEEVAA